MAKKAGKWFIDAQSVGFIEQEGGKDGFPHYSDIMTEGRKSVEQGSHVSFEITDSPNNVTSGTSKVRKKGSMNSPTSTSIVAFFAAVTLATVSASAARPNTVELPAGSVDQLAAAIAAAGPRGTVIVKSGIHEESGAVSVTIPVNILGEEGAVVQCGTLPDPSLPSVITPTIHILNTHDVTVKGLQFVPAQEYAPGVPAADCAVLIESSSRASVLDNTILGFHLGVLIQEGHHSLIRGNTIQISPIWLELETLNASTFVGIQVLNGRHTRIIDNQVSFAVFGIFANDRNGQIISNSASDNYIGFMFCNAFPVYEISGQVVGAETPATGWHATGNNATGNQLVGYLVIDGANNNVLNNNAASDNGFLDIHLVGETDFFGIGVVMPTTYDNVVAQGSQKGLIIMDCGQDNRVSGDVDQVPCPY